MMSTLTNTIYGDPSLNPGHDGKVMMDLRMVGDDWPSKAHTMVGKKRLRNIMHCLINVFTSKVPGDFIETGVFRGGASIFANAVIQAYKEDRKVFVADSFEGFPNDREEDQGDACLEHNHFFAVSLEEVQSNFQKYHLLTPNVTFLKGWFSETLPNLKGPFSVIRLDGDMYSSTMDSLNNLYEKLSPAGFCIIDDYLSHERCKEAVDTFREERGIKDQIVQIDNQGVYWRKTN